MNTLDAVSAMNERKDQAAYGYQIFDSIAGGRPVVLVSHGFQTNYERGFTNGLADNGVDVTLISSDQTDYAGLRSSVRKVNLRGSQDKGRPKWAKALNMLRYHIRLLIYAISKRHSIFQVIGLIYPPLLHGVIEGLWFRLVCKSYVLTVHDLLPHDLHTAWYRLLYGLSFRIPHRLVVHTTRMREELVRRYALNPDRIIVMEHGIEPVYSTDIIANRAFNPTDKLKILFFGIVAPYKGLDILLTAIEPLSGHVNLLIAGAARDEGVARDIKKSIASHPAHEHITWLNKFIPESDLANIFTEADVLVLPYRHIDQSGVLFQAFRYGLPVIATRVGSFHEYVTHEIGEICEPGDPESLRDAIRKMRGRSQAISREKIKDNAKKFYWVETSRALYSAYTD